jgi:HAE1 family hydrophobic/amphiphilic exporter-1
MTLSLIAVFIPVMFMGGIVGRLFHEFAVVISVAILISGIVAITLTPMLCSRFVKAHGHGDADRGRKNWLVGGFDRGFNAVQRGYGDSLRWCMDRPRLVLAAFGLSLLATALLFYVAPKDFIPAGDNGTLHVNTEGPEDVSFDGMLARQQKLVDIVAADPNIAGYMSSIGAGGSRSTVNNGSILLLLKPANQRKLDVDGITAELRRKLAAVTGIRAYIQNTPAIRIGGRQSKAQYQYTLQSIDMPALYDWSGRVTRAFAALPGFEDVTNDLDLNSPSIVVKVDRARLAPLGLTMAQVQTALGIGFGEN